MVGGACRRVPSSRGLGAAASPERPVARGASVMKRRALLSAAASPHPRWPHPRWPRHPQRRPTAWSPGPRPPEVPRYAVRTARDGTPEARLVCVQRNTVARQLPCASGTYAMQEAGTSVRRPRGVRVSLGGRELGRRGGERQRLSRVELLRPVGRVEVLLLGRALHAGEGKGW